MENIIFGESICIQYTIGSNAEGNRLSLWLSVNRFIYSVDTFDDLDNVTYFIICDNFTDAAKLETFLQTPIQRS